MMQCQSAECGYLPVTTITAAATSATAVTASATTAASATTPSSVTAIASTSATPAAAFSLRTGFIDDESAAKKVFSVQRSDGFFGFGVVTDFGESKATRLPGKSIAKQG